MALQKKMIISALTIAAIMMMAGVLALIQSIRTIPSSGTIAGVNLGIYTTDQYNTPLTSVSWGTISNGTSTNKTIYVRNDGKSLSMKISLSNSTWNPSDANTYLTLTWDQEGTVLAPAAYTPANLTLAVSPTFTNGTDFSVNIIITGTEQ
jgi:hypothetical protein